MLSYRVEGHEEGIGPVLKEEIMKKQLLIAGASLITILMLCGCGGKVKLGESYKDDDIRAELTGVEIDKNKGTGSTIFESKVKLVNEGEEEITRVTYKLVCYAKDGTQLGYYSFTYNGNDTAIEPGGSVTDERGFQDNFEKEAYRMEIVDISAETIEEVPLVHLPQAGESLPEALAEPHMTNIETEPPVAIDIVIDHGGVREVAAVTDEATIRELVDAFAGATIAKETQEFVTDNYNSVSFTFADGTTKSISLNRTNLEVSFSNNYFLYELNDFGPFWKLCNELADYEDPEAAEYYGGS